MNEPHRGYIDLPSLHEFDYSTDLHLSHVRMCLRHHSALSILTPVPSICFPVVYACIRLSDFCWILDPLIPFPNSSYCVRCLEPNGQESMAEGWADRWEMRVGDAWCLGVRYSQEGGRGSQRELLRQAPDDREEGGLLSITPFTAHLHRSG